LARGVGRLDRVGSVKVMDQSTSQPKDWSRQPRALREPSL
jgi:hypothetical protein